MARPTLIALPLLLFLLGACTFRLPSNPVTDFLAHDGAGPETEGEGVLKPAILDLPPGIEERAWKPPLLNEELDPLLRGGGIGGPAEAPALPETQKGRTLPTPFYQGPGGEEAEPPAVNPEEGQEGPGKPPTEAEDGEQPPAAGPQLEPPKLPELQFEGESAGTLLRYRPNQQTPEEELEGLDPYIALLIPLPVIATDPNTGVSVGVLPVTVLRQYKRITAIMAPSITWNELEGLDGTFRLRRYPDRSSELLVDVGGSLNGAQDLEVKYTSLNLPPGNLYGTVRGRYFQELSNRFFGVGNGSDEDAETTYTNREVVAGLTLGVNLPYDFALQIAERYRRVRLIEGEIDDLPQLEDDFPETPGVEDNVEIFAHQASLIYDSRDSEGVPTEGLYFRFSWEIGDKNVGSDFTFQRFQAEIKFLIPFLDKTLITAGRVRYTHITLGDEDEPLPFYERSVLGGKETNRGYGYGRFWDNDVLLLSLEQRWNVVAFELMDVSVELQLAGFVDIGRVFANSDELDDVDRDLKIAGGAAIRLVVPDSDLVTSIDVGLSDEGTAAFVGLGYPY